MRLSPDELNYARSNIKYIMQTTNLTPYRRDMGQQDFFYSVECLPSSRTLAKINDETYHPSLNVISKMCDFYNANFADTISISDFVTQSLTDRAAPIISRGNMLSPYSGDYQLLYPSDSYDELHYGLMHISPAHKHPQVYLIMGISNNEIACEYYDKFICRIAALSTPKQSTGHFNRMRNDIDAQRKNSYLCIGSIQNVNNRSITISTTNCNNQDHLMFLTINLDEDMIQLGSFNGALGLYLSPAVSSLETRTAQFGILRIKNASEILPKEKTSQLSEYFKQQLTLCNRTELSTRQSKAFYIQASAIK